MAILKCKCGYIKEVPSKYEGRVVKCPKCGEANRVLNTEEFIKKLIIAYQKRSGESRLNIELIDSLRQELSKDDSRIEELNRKLTDSEKRLSELKGNFNNLKRLNSSQKKSYRAEIKKLKEQIEELKSNSVVSTNNISHTEEFSPEKQDYSILSDWFAKKSMSIEIDPKLMDTRGFFDEVAITLGDNFDILKDILNQMRYIQSKGYDTIKIPLEKRSKEQIEIIDKFCKEIYDYSFASKYFFDKKKKAIYIEVQKAKKIVNFFNGMWMEWYIFMVLLDYLKDLNISNSIIRGLKVTYGNGDKNEFDIFLMIDKTPIVIECKSGEFRREIRKYTDIKDRLGLKKEQFILCIVGLDDNQVEGFTNTYDITFSNQKSIVSSIQYAINHKDDRKGFLNRIKNPFRR